MKQLVMFSLILLSNLAFAHSPGDPAGLLKELKVASEALKTACRKYDTEVLALIKEAGMSEYVVESNNFEKALALFKNSPGISAHARELRAEAIEDLLKPDNVNDVLAMQDRCNVPEQKLVKGLIGALKSSKDAKQSQAVIQVLKSFVRDPAQETLISLSVDAVTIEKMANAGLLTVSAEKAKSLSVLRKDIKELGHKLQSDLAKPEQVGESVRREFKAARDLRTKLVQILE